MNVRLDEIIRRLDCSRSEQLSGNSGRSHLAELSRKGERKKSAKVRGVWLLIPRTLLRLGLGAFYLQVQEEATGSTLHSLQATREMIEMVKKCYWGMACRASK